MSDDYLGHTAKEWHFIALEWKRKAMEAKLAAETVQRDVDLLAKRLIEEAR